MSSIFALTSSCSLPSISAVNTCIFEILASPVVRPKILEIIIDFNPGTTATPPCIAIGKSATAGVPIFTLSAINLNNPLIPNATAEDTGLPGPNNYTQILTTGQWSYGPTQPTTFIRRITPISTIATPVNPPYYFEFPMGLAIPPSNSISVWLTNQTLHATSYNWNLTAVMEC